MALLRLYLIDKVVQSVTSRSSIDNPTIKTEGRAHHRLPSIYSLSLTIIIENQTTSFESRNLEQLAFLPIYGSHTLPVGKIKALVPGVRLATFCFDMIYLIDSSSEYLESQSQGRF